MTIRDGPFQDDPRLAALLSLVRESAANTGSVRDAPWQAAIDAGWTDVELTEASVHIALQPVHQPQPWAISASTTTCAWWLGRKAVGSSATRWGHGRQPGRLQAAPGRSARWCGRPRLSPGRGHEVGVAVATDPR